MAKKGNKGEGFNEALLEDKQPEKEELKKGKRKRFDPDLPCPGCGGYVSEDWTIGCIGPDGIEGTGCGWRPA